MERKPRLEKVVAMLAVETEGERRVRMEYDAATKQLSLAMETDEERKARLEKMVATTPLEREKERRTKKESGFDFDLIWIEIGVFKKFFFQGMSSLAL